MKKLFITTLGVLIAIAVIAMPSTTQISPDKLPSKTHDFIHKYFASTEISGVSEMDDAHHKLYVVNFANGDVASFDTKTGECMSIHIANGSVPMAVIPEKVRADIEKRCPGAEINSIARMKDGVYIGLNSGEKLCFDRDGRMVKAQCDGAKMCDDKGKTDVHHTKH